MVRWLREWWNGKEVIRPGTGGMVGPIPELPEYDQIPPHWTAMPIKRLIAWHIRNWDKFWTLAISLLSLLISCIALSRSG